MKYIIVGLHGSGKQEIMDFLNEKEIQCGRLFTNAPIVDERYDYFTDADIRSLFENKAYIFFKEMEGFNNNTFEGLSFYEFDNKDVFALSQDQVMAIPNVPLCDEVCFVWLDNTLQNRKTRYKNERRSYNFNEREEIEKKDDSEFVKMIYNFPNSHILYFNNEEPLRVATIIYTLVKEPKFLEIFEQNFN